MFCSKCGKNMPDDSAFCPSCAAPTGTGGSPEVTPVYNPPIPPQNTPPKKKKGCLIALLIPVGLAVIFALYCFISVLFEPDNETFTDANETMVSDISADMDINTVTTAVASLTGKTTTQPITTQQKATETSAQTVVISAEMLINAYLEDEAQADNLYKGRLLEVTGTISTLGYDSSPPDIYIGSADPMAEYSVQCFIKTGSVEKAAAMIPGDEATITGTCSGFSQGDRVVLNNCTIQ